MMRCAKCSIFWYCGKVCLFSEKKENPCFDLSSNAIDQTCQEVGWKEKGHKHECKLLVDSDVWEIVMDPNDFFTEE
jgi:hypothetical protein